MRRTNLSYDVTPYIPKQSIDLLARGKRGPRMYSLLSFLRAPWNVLLMMFERWNRRVFSPRHIASDTSVARHRALPGLVRELRLQQA